ncbi:MAG TPA: hypothetical protein VG796_28395 [Verrucomicrobiales bacterium]|nr:hypothetical protein [Verrucomicrobiales bacterium]
MKTLCFLLLPLTVFVARAQVADSPAPGAPGTAPGNTTIINNSSQPQKPNSILGNDVPFMDPGSETAQWDGKVWNITNNRLFRARFEKYLAAPEENGAKDKEYRDLLLNSMKAMAPSRPGGPSVAATMQLLVKAADYPIDARICDSIAQAVYGVVLHQRNERALAAKNKELAKELRDLGWNMEVAGEAKQTREKMEATTNGKGQSKTVQREFADYSRSAQDIKKMVEIDASRVANAAKMTASELKSKVEFQALIVQLFLQRRFEHVIIACRLYRNLYEDGDTELKLKEGSDVEKMFTRTTGTTPTVTALDAMSSEFIRDVDEGVVSFGYHVEKEELESASKRLSESFMMGEYLPKMRTLPRAQKDKVRGFVRDANQLLSAIEVKDYTLAEELVERMRKTAKDFDYSKPRAAIETARAESGLHIQAARSAAIKKDEKAAAEAIKQAALVWPTNPDLKAFSTQVASYGDMNSRMLNDLDSLIAQKNFREIFREQLKYAGAVLGKPEYEKKLKEVVDKVASVEKVVITADEMVRSGDSYGAWERLKEISADFPDDNEVNKRISKLSETCAEFSRILTTAAENEKKDRYGLSLSGYLRARQIYPNSLFAKDGIERLADKILPESGNAVPNNTPPRPREATPPADPFSPAPAESLTPVNAPASR